MIFSAAFVVTLGAVFVWVGQGPGKPLPPEFVLYAKDPKPVSDQLAPVGAWADPSAVAMIGGRLFVLDSGNDRVIEVDREGRAVAVLCESGDCRFLLKEPRAMAALGGELYIANTGAGQVVVLAADGSASRSIDIRAPGAPATGRFLPSGIAVSPNGEIYVADTEKNTVLRLSNDGGESAVFLDGVGDSEKYRLSRPTGLAVDASGNVYVASSGSGRIRKYSPEGRHLQEFAMRSNPEYFSPAYVALDASGNVYFTDNRSRMVYVYNQQGTLVGVVGLLNASRVDSPGVLREPAGLLLAGDTLYVADRESGLFGFRIDREYWKTVQRANEWVHR